MFWRLAPVPRPPVPCPAVAAAWPKAPPLRHPIRSGAASFTGMDQVVSYTLVETTENDRLFGAGRSTWLNISLTGEALVIKPWGRLICLKDGRDDETWPFTNGVSLAGSCARPLRPFPSWSYPVQVDALFDLAPEPLPLLRKAAPPRPSFASVSWRVSALTVLEPGTAAPERADFFGTRPGPLRECP